MTEVKMHNFRSRYSSNWHVLNKTGHKSSCITDHYKLKIFFTTFNVDIRYWISSKSTRKMHTGIISPLNIQYRMSTNSAVCFVKMCCDTIKYLERCYQWQRLSSTITTIFCKVQRKQRKTTGVKLMGHEYT